MSPTWRAMIPLTSHQSRSFSGHFLLFLLRLILLATLTLCVSIFNPSTLLHRTGKQLALRNIHVSVDIHVRERKRERERGAKNLSSHLSSWSLRNCRFNFAFKSQKPTRSTQHSENEMKLDRLERECLCFSNSLALNTPSSLLFFPDLRDKTSTCGRRRRRHCKSAKHHKNKTKTNGPHETRELE